MAKPTSVTNAAKILKGLNRCKKEDFENRLAANQKKTNSFLALKNRLPPFLLLPEMLYQIRW